MNETALLQNYLIVGAMLFAIGVVGLLVRRNLIIMFLAVEMMLQGVSLSLVAWGRYHNDWSGQMLVVFIIVVAACEAAVALALVLALFRSSGSLDVAVWHQLREETVPAFEDRNLPDESPPQSPSWPKLATAGVQPEVPPEKTDYRNHV